MKYTNNKKSRTAPTGRNKAQLAILTPNSYRKLIEQELHKFNSPVTHPTMTQAEIDDLIARAKQRR